MCTLELNLNYLLSQLYLSEDVEDLNECGILLWRSDHRFCFAYLVEKLADVLAVCCKVHMEEVLMVT